MVATVTPTSDLSTAIGSDPGLDRLYDNVQAEVPGIGLSMIKLSVWNTIEEFYLRSTVQRQSVYWRMGPGIVSVDFNPFDAEWLVAWVLSFSGLHNARIEPPSVLRDLAFPAPNSEREGRALLVLRPVDLDVDFPSDLFVQWFDVILAGTLARLYGQSVKPWSAPQLAVFHGQRFRAGIRRARDIAQRSFADGVGRWSFPLFAHGRRKS